MIVKYMEFMNNDSIIEGIKIQTGNYIICFKRICVWKTRGKKFQRSTKRDDIWKVCFIDIN